MLKYSFILIGIYFLYYAGNIVYDLFLKKEKIVATDESEEFSLVSFAKTESPPESRIEIDDVENIRTTKSYMKVHLPVSIDPSTDFDPLDLEEMRRKFEAEEELDGDIPTPQSVQKIPIPETKEEKLELQEEADKVVLEEVHNENQTSDEVEIDVGKDDEKKIPIPKPSAVEQENLQWNKIVNLAQTSIKMVKNYEGEKVYHSTM